METRGAAITSISRTTWPLTRRQRPALLRQTGHHSSTPTCPTSHTHRNISSSNNSRSSSNSSSNSSNNNSTVRYGEVMQWKHSNSNNDEVASFISWMTLSYFASEGFFTRFSHAIMQDAEKNADPSIKNTVHKQSNFFLDVTRCSTEFFFRESTRPVANEKMFTHNVSIMFRHLLYN